MVTFISICLAISLLLAIAAGIIVILGVSLSGVLLIVLDVIVGVTPFVLAFMLIRWLFKKRG